MAVEEKNFVELRDDFYRDSIGKVVIVIVGYIIAILSLILLSLYLYLAKPAPVTFLVGDEMRVLAPVPLNLPFLTDPDLLQWVADVFPRAFTFDFNHYDDQLKRASQSFTEDGWKTFVNQLNIYANYNNVQTNKLFVNGTPAAAPSIFNKGPIQETGKYGWWVDIPVSINYAGYKPPPNKVVTFRVLVVRVSTLNNLTGVGIDKVIQATPPTTARLRNDRSEYFVG